MPADGDNTPAAPRRLHPPSASTARPDPYTPQSSRAPFKFARSSQFSSSVGAHQTPHFKPTSRATRDEIETGVDQVSSSPPLVSRVKLRPSQALSNDIVDDEDESEGERAPGFPVSRTDDPPEDEANYDSLDELIAPRRRTKRPSSASAQFRPARDRFSPSPERNALRVQARNLADPPGETDPHRDDHETEPSDASVSPTRVHPTTFMRFRPGRTPSDPSQRPPSSHKPRPAFKPAPLHGSPHHPPTSPLHPAALPDAFTPSRRRGKRDYVPNGAADTVRNWVLSLAADQTQAPGLAHARPAGPRFREIRVTSLRRDRSGRCAVVRDADAHAGGKLWMLIAGAGRRAGGLDEVGEGSVVVVPEGEDGGWDVDVDLDMDMKRPAPDSDGVQHHRSESGLRRRRHQCRVAVLWSVRGDGERRGAADEG